VENPCASAMLSETYDNCTRGENPPNHMVLKTQKLMRHAIKSWVDQRSSEVGWGMGTDEQHPLQISQTITVRRRTELE
jgi:hypothetical protein